MDDSPAMTESWPAPAKINLFLHITGRRDDGYHELQTVFQFLDYCDELKFRPRQDGKLVLESNYRDVDPENDLIIRAARLIQHKTGISQGISVSVHKRIPMGGGLGGGSSDAATTLTALNQLWGAGLTATALADMALELGADVPVFVYGHSAWAEGVGEKLVPVEPAEDWFLVIHPGCQVPTALIFNTPDLTRNSPPITIRDFAAGAGHNDCEQVVYRDFPEVARAAKWLGQWTAARLTGTGACVFGRFQHREAAMEVLERLPKTWSGFVSKGKNVSPLAEKLKSARQQSI